MTNETAIELIESASIAPVRRSILTISEQQVSRIKLLAGMMADSQLEYRKMKTDDIFIKMMKGLEVGLEPVASMDLIDVIQGKPTLKPQGMLALVHGSGQLSDISIIDDGTACTVKMKRGDMQTHIETFSVDDAKSMKLDGKDNWKKQPAVMRKWRAISAACRVVFPDIIQGMYIPEELSPETVVDDNGEIVEAQFTDVVEETPKKQSSAPTKEDRPEVYTCKFTHMCYRVNGQKYLGFANCDPVKNPNTANKVIIRAYGRTTKVKQWLGDFAYNELNLDQYTGATDTTQFIKMPIDVEFEYVEETTKQGDTYLKAIGVVGSDDSF